jgi:predicted ABC-type transport system involved in lysophospholipase L1 biosynthesis ATPase subunit
MKRSTLKLVIRHETIRVLSGLDLVRVAGGEQVAVAGTGGANTGCPLVAQLVGTERPQNV